MNYKNDLNTPNVDHRMRNSKLNKKKKILFSMISFRRIANLEQDIRHAYVEMKSLMQTEEKVYEYIYRYR